VKQNCFAATIVLFFVPLAAHGEQATGSHIKAMGAFVAISVADLDASTRWYSEKLGLQIVKREPKRDRAAVVVLEGGGLVVELVQLDDAQPLSKAAPRVAKPELVHGMFKAGILVEDFEQALATLRARKVEIAYGPFPARPGERANVIVRDNAGNLLQFFGPMGR
jgi:catechol 2,3-dioxygenase-like lactoylglutathione lyase family enzyme